MKIGLDISQVVYQTGVSRYRANLVENLLKIDQQNHYFLFAGSIRQKKLLKAFYQQLKTNKTSYKLSNLSPKLLNIFWNHLSIFPPNFNQNLDLFHASNWAIPKTSCPLITTIHDLTFLKYPQEHLPYYIKAHTLHLKRTKKYADKVIAVSHATKKDLVDYGLEESKVVVIHSASAKIFKPLTKDKIKTIKAKYNLKGQYLLSVGTQEPRKNLQRLIKAFSHLNLSKINLVIVGKFGWGDRTKPIPNV